MKKLVTALFLMLIPIFAHSDQISVIPSPTGFDDDTSFINLYNKLFKTSFSNINDVEKDNASRIKKYYEDVRGCVPGTSQYITSFFGFTFITSTIQGKQNNICQVESVVEMYLNAEAPPQTQIQKCAFSQQSLAAFTEKEAEQIISGTTFTFDSSHLTPLQAAFQNECEYFQETTFKKF